MKKLYELQNDFQNTILRSEPIINSALQEPPRGTLEERVAIYTDGFYLRLEEALASDYELLASFLGEKEFTRLSHHYVKVFPSYSYSLNFFGQYLQQFLTQTPPYNKRKYLAEIASVEWAEYMAMVAADAPLLTASDLQILTLEQWLEKTFKLHPSCSLILLSWNSLSVLEALANDVRLGIRKLKKTQALLIWRRKIALHHMKLDSMQLAILSAIEKGSSFLEICDSVHGMVPEEEAAAYIAKELYQLLEQGILALN